jgi:hypothetical protein
MRKARLIKKLWDRLELLTLSHEIIDGVIPAHLKDREPDAFDDLAYTINDLRRILEAEAIREAQRGNLAIDICASGHFNGVEVVFHEPAEPRPRSVTLTSGHENLTDEERLASITANAARNTARWVAVEEVISPHEVHVWVDFWVGDKTLNVTVYVPREKYDDPTFDLDQWVTEKVKRELDWQRENDPKRFEAGPPVFRRIRQSATCPRPINLGPEVRS